MKPTEKKGVVAEIETLKFFLKNIAWISKKYVVSVFAVSILNAALPFIYIITPKLIIDELMNQKRIDVLLTIVAIAVGLNLIINFIVKKTTRYINVCSYDIQAQFEIRNGRFMMGIPYENVEDPKFIDLKERAMFPMRSRDVVGQITTVVPILIKYILILSGTFALMCTFDVLSIIIIIIPIIVTTYFNTRYQKKEIEIQKSTTAMNKSYLYYFDTIANFSNGKDIRMFEMQNLIMKKVTATFAESVRNVKRIEILKYNFEGLTSILSSFRIGFTYGYIAIKTISNYIGVGSFMMYISAAMTFSEAVTNIFNNIVELRQSCRYLADYVELHKIPNEEKAENTIQVPADKDVCLEFKNVFFKYPNTDVYILKDLSFKLDSGESVSIVGMNGAGKTTIIKLAARLFKPTKGEILLNGININNFDIKSYSDLISVVFQDFKLPEFSIKDVITSCRQVDEEKLKTSIEKAGLTEKINSLALGADTYITKRLNDDGLEFSGGEMQKIAIARAAYKDSPIIVLDEPTAALDPLAEAEVYERFNSYIMSKTALYISHRLSSCKFCDKIFFICDGKILEEGSHDDLIRKQGNYAEMFNLQASQYVK